MVAYKRIALLANSRKHSGRCLAGKEWVQGGGWIRPVSARPGEEVSEEERQYEDGSDPALLDIVDIPLVQAKPHACHTENWLFSDQYYWIKRGVLTWQQAVAMADRPATLWVNGSHTNAGLNDEMLTSVASLQPYSICMIHVPAVSIRVSKPWDKRVVRAHFEYNGTQYNLKVTDPKIERQYLAGSNGSYDIGECLLAISLAEPFVKGQGDSCQYKLIAAIIQP